MSTPGDVNRNGYGWYILPIITVLTVLLYLLSLKYRFLDIFVVGAHHGKIGYDFFSIPASFTNLLDHRSIYNRTFYHFGPYATWYPYHPAISLMFGSWLSLFKPWTAYGIFVAISIGMMLYSAYLISTLTRKPLLKQLCYFLILCTFPTYLMLWNAQMHVFTILSVTLIMVGLFEAFSENASASRIQYKVLTGLLISLFTKPIVLLFFPVLLATRETRYSTVMAAILYGLVSLLFLFIPFLNPTGSNEAHWSNIYHQSSLIMSGNVELFSLSTFMNHLLGREIHPFFYKIPALLMLLVSAVNLFVIDKKERMILALLTVILAISSYYLSYNTIWEYQYTTILPAIAMIAILYNSNVMAADKNILLFILCAAVLFYFPTLYFLFPDTYPEHLTLYRVTRVGPVVLVFAAMFYLIVTRAYNTLSLQKNKTGHATTAVDVQ
jgi:hypothetical protein